MFKTNFIAWLRFLRTQKISSLLNISGLTIGITSCILIALFIIDELSYDRHNKNADRIYRVVQSIRDDNGSNLNIATTPPAIAEVIKYEVPEIENVVRLFPRGWDNNYYVRYGDKKYLEENICRADTNIFDVFTIPFEQGNAHTALADPLSIVITASIAKKYFGNEDPIGKVLQIDDWKPRKVTAVIRDIPANSHFHIDFLVPLESDPMGEVAGSWNWNSFYTYIKIKPDASIANVEAKIKTAVSKKQPATHLTLYTQPLTAIHLNSHLQSEILANSDRSYSYMLGIVAFLILLIACINYVNLTIAQSFKRSKEIGIRKVNGAVRSTLIGQFLTESTILAIVATLAAIGIAYLTLPFVNTFTGKSLTLFPYASYSFVACVVGFGLLVGLTAGLYPAFYQSSIKPLNVLKGENASSRKGLGYQKILIVGQFAIAITLLIGTIVMMRQVEYMQQARLGLDKERVLVVNDINYLSGPEKTTLKTALMQIPGISEIAAADGAPAGQTWSRMVSYNGLAQPQMINYLSVDEHFIPALKVSIKEGSNFRVSEDSIREVVLNETAVQQLAIPAPVIGQQLLWEENSTTGEKKFATIVGVVKDFHFTSMRTEIMPFIFINNSRRQWKYIIKINSVDLSQTLDRIKKVWDAQVRSRPFQFTFLDETFGRLYAAEMNFRNICRWITGIAIFLSCMGLFSLSSFMTAQRTKEIGIRKVLGASATRVVVMLWGEYIKLVLIAAALSLPLSWWMMNMWLQDFAYRVELDLGTPVLSTTLIIVIALFTVCFQTLRAALANPVKSLKKE